MSTDVEFSPLPDGPEGAGGSTRAFEADLARLTGVSVELTVEVGRTRMSLGETMDLGPGSVVTLDRLADKPVDLLVNGRSIARGEVVVIDEQFGLRITEVVGVADGTAASATAFEPTELGADAAAEPAPPAQLAAAEPVAPAEPAGGDATMDADAIAALFAQADAA